MRILEIRFKNLNSLAGEWAVDLTHPAYTSDGIFAITGPTGSGKTTILDAVCLALYGRTPRLNNISATANEIMTRQMGECWAEVVFETRAGRFRCHWSQHRARRRPDGNLQNARHEIADAETGQVLESKLRDVAARVEAVTGMDFDRFTRSMLLAQGGFAAFLQAPPDERAPILEQITGTEIYSHISIKVHERRVQERRKLENLKTELAGMRLLVPEQEQALRSVLQEQSERESQLAKKVNCWRQALTWLETMTGLEKELGALDAQWQDFEKRREQFQPELKRLERARRALVLEGDYIKVSGLRTQQSQEQGELEKTQDLFPALKTNLDAANESKQNAEEQFKIERETQKQAAEIIKKVRELDVNIVNEKQLVKKCRSSIQELQRQYQQCIDQIKSDQESLQTSRKALHQVESYLEQNAVDAELVTNLKAIAKVFGGLQVTESKCSDLRKDLITAGNNKELALKSGTELAADLQQSRSALEQIEDDHRQLVQEIQARLQGRELSEWRTGLDTLKERQSLLKTTAEVRERIIQAQKVLGELKTRAHDLVKEHTRQAAAIKSFAEKKTASAREVEHLQARVVLLNRIRDLEAERAYLKDGQPCPLCGATRHPYAEGHVPALDETESALQQARSNLQTILDNLADLQIRQATTARDLDQVREETQKQQAALEADEKLYTTALLELRIEADPAEGLVILQNELPAVQTQIKQYTALIAEVEQKERNEKARRKSLEAAQAAWVEADKSLREAQHKQEMAEHEYDRLEQEYKTLQEQLARELEAARQEIAAYGVTELPVARLESILKQLTQRGEAWQSKQAEKNALEKHIIGLTNALEKQTILRNKLDEDLRIKHEEYTRLLEQCMLLSRERSELYGDKHPDAEEERLAGMVEQAERALEEARTEQEEANKELNHLQARIESLHQSLQRRAGELTQAEQNFSSHLQRDGFTDESDYRAACLPEAERERLARQAESLNREQTELETRRMDKANRLRAEHAKAITEQSREEVEQALSTGETSRKEIQQEIGAIKQQLDRNEALRAEQQQRLTALKQQQREFERWEMLHDLIGSADGKKYRNFAQGLTFEIMVAHANRQLQKMTDRYLLVRDEDQPLELNVIDSYQAGEIRSTKNLSGGESFIVSLALALGLSYMASRKVRVDSLFLDEGFGTLDEDALDTALDTLAGLQQDGKLIGVISHVAALKERISTQIQVVRETSGRSSICGPGCRQIRKVRDGSSLY